MLDMVGFLANRHVYEKMLLAEAFLASVEE
jgi:hypothetical protein